MGFPDPKAGTRFCVRLYSVLLVEMKSGLAEDLVPEKERQDERKEGQREKGDV